MSLKITGEIKIGNFIIKTLDSGSIWIEKESGEGVVVSSCVFKDSLEKIFKKYFCGA